MRPRTVGHSFVLTLALSGLLRADVVELSRGGVLRGELQESDRKDVLIIETLSGAVVEIAVEDVKGVSNRSLAAEQHDRMAAHAQDTVEAHWELAEWCFESGLEAQRDEHLRRIVELDPDHEDAQRRLGRVKLQGKWTTRDGAMQERGYVKYKGRYVSKPELALLKQLEERRGREDEWRRTIARWAAALRRGTATQQQDAVRGLRAIDDPHAVPGLVRSFQNDSNLERRLMYVELLGQIPGEAPVKPLIVQSLRDVDGRVREAAAKAIPPDQHGLATLYLSESLGSKSNQVVRRAATTLAVVGTREAIPRLIDALVTTHKHNVTVADQSNTIGFRVGGGFATPGESGSTLPVEVEAAARLGQLPHGVIVHSPSRPVITRTVTVDKAEQNAEVLVALQTLTKTSFGYDQRAWRRWWSDQESVAADSLLIP